MKKLFVWDFHGVLEQGNELAVKKITNEILKKYNYKERLSDSNATALYGEKWHKYFEAILPYENEATLLKLQEACFEYSKNHREIIDECISPTPNSHDVLEKIKAMHEQILISNSDPDALEYFIDSVNIRKYFEKNYFATSIEVDNVNYGKNHILKEFLRNKKYDRIVIVGDSQSDMNLRNVAGGITYHYSHKYVQPKKCTSDYKIDSLEELLAEI